MMLINTMWLLQSKRVPIFMGCLFSMDAYYPNFINCPALLRLHLIGGQRLVEFTPLLPPHHCSVATRGFQSSSTTPKMSSGCVGPPSPASPPRGFGGSFPLDCLLQLTSLSSSCHSIPSILCPISNEHQPHAAGRDTKH